MANRSMDAKFKRAKLQRVALGMAEASKPAYHTNKPALRLIAAQADETMVKRESVRKSVPNVAMVMYNPRQPQHKLPVMWAAMVDCDGELVKRKAYLAR